MRPSGPFVPENTTRPRAGATTVVPKSDAMSRPAWNCSRPVNGEMRLP